MEEWKLTKIGSICKKVCSGGTPKSTVKEYYGGGIPWLNTKEVHFNRIYSTESTITDKGLNNCAAKWIEANAVIIAMYGATAAKCAIGMIPMTTNQACCNLMIDKKKADYRFVYYAIANSYSILASLANGGAQQNLNAQVIKDFEILLPSLVVQKRVADVLSTLDDKIECSKRINDNLEQQAQALFKSWFVDFEPYKGSGFEETEIGRIPKDLLVKRVSEIPHTIETGRRPKGGVGEITSGVPSVGAEHVKGLGNYDYSKTKYITEEYASSLKTGKVNGYELLIYKDGGKPGYFIPNYSIFGEGYPFEECFLNEHVFKLDFGNKGYNAFCYFYFWTDYVMNYLNAQGGKAAIPGINRQDIENIQIFAPENELVKRFGDIVLPSIRQILFNCKESRRLAQLRDTLLPRLMSGELKVNEVDCLS